MGTPEISVPSLKRLISDGHEICGVVTQPDRPKGRGKKLIYSPVKEEALNNKLNIFQPTKVSDLEFVDKLKNLNPDLIVVMAFGQILKKNILDIPKYGCINIHVSLLPKYRGAAPINWAIINGENKTGITTIFMNEGLDTGDIIMTKEFDLDDEINAGQLHDWMMEEGANIISETIASIENNTYTSTKQDNSLATYAHMMDKKLGHIDFNNLAKDIHNLVRGTIPWPGAWCDSDYGKIKIWKSKLTKTKPKNKAGTIERVSKDGIEVACIDYILLIEEIQFPNKKRMKVSEYIKGNLIEEGKVLR